MGRGGAHQCEGEARGDVWVLICTYMKRGGKDGEFFLFSVRGQNSPFRWEGNINYKILVCFFFKVSCFGANSNSFAAFPAAISRKVEDLLNVSS